jgi:hypothetical protein
LIETANTKQLWVELWVSLASLLRSYTAVHGLSANRQASIEHNEDRILARHGNKWLELNRNCATIAWKREDGNQGTLKLTETGRLQTDSNEEEMDLAAEQWARELMQ